MTHIKLNKGFLNGYKKVGGLTYSLPEVWLLQNTGIGTCELAARTAYDSFINSEHEVIAEDFNSGAFNTESINQLNDIKSSSLLDDLAWTYFHHSVLEHANLTYLIKGISRGVLQEHARHRIQGITVRSTRYTMGKLINAFNTDKYINQGNAIPSDWFIETVLGFNMFVTQDVEYNKLQIQDIWKKLTYQKSAMDEGTFLKDTMSREQLNWITSDLSSSLTQDDVFTMLQRLKKKRNVGDILKHIVNDNWKVDMVVTFNLRSLKNYFELRDSGAAFWQIQKLAKAMKEATPEKYLRLIDKSYKKNK